ncbi:MAG: endonuclease/exonuclease/phosphatase family protein [Actinomycetota bacterium]
MILTQKLRVATFNIHHAEGVDGVVDVGRIAAALDRLGADVIALQEVDRGWERSGEADQAAEIRRLTGMEVVFWPTVTRAGSEYGIAVATAPGAAPPAAASFEVLPRLGTEEPRGFIRMDGDGVTIFATHLSRARRARAIQTRRLAEVIGRTSGPVVLLGDLNQTPRALGPLRAAGLDAGPATLPTLPSSGPRRQVDFVLAGGGARVAEAWTHRTLVSDHVPLVAVIDFAGAGPST